MQNDTPETRLTADQVARSGRLAAATPSHLIVLRRLALVAYALTSEGSYRPIGRRRPLPSRCSDFQAQAEARDWGRTLDPPVAGEAAA